VLGDRESREAGVVVQHAGDLRPEGMPALVHLAAEDPQGAVRGRQQTRHGAQDGGLAGPVRPHDGERGGPAARS
jgi:hypothetical protein